MAGDQLWFMPGSMEESSIGNDANFFADPERIRAATQNGYQYILADTSFPELGVWTVFSNQNYNEKVVALRRILCTMATRFLLRHIQKLDTDQPGKLSIDIREPARLALGETDENKRTRAQSQILWITLRMAAQAAKEYWKPLFSARVEKWSRSFETPQRTEQ